jgi:hypothetical protein
VAGRGSGFRFEGGQDRSDGLDNNEHGPTGFKGFKHVKQLPEQYSAMTSKRFFDFLERNALLACLIVTAFSLFAFGLTLVASSLIGFGDRPPILKLLLSFAIILPIYFGAPIATRFLLVSCGVNSPALDRFYLRFKSWFMRA